MILCDLNLFPFPIFVLTALYFHQAFRVTTLASSPVIFSSQQNCFQFPFNISVFKTPFPSSFSFKGNLLLTAVYLNCLLEYICGYTKFLGSLKLSMKYII